MLRWRHLPCRAATVTAETWLVCYSLARPAFNNLLGPIEDVWRFEALCKVPILFSLTDPQLYELARCMKYQTLQANQLVFSKGDPGELELHCLHLCARCHRQLVTVKSSCMQH